MEKVSQATASGKQIENTFERKHCKPDQPTMKAFIL
jgi:hypothetical protein